MKKLTGLFSLAVLSAVFLSGCATVTRGPTQMVKIDSSPDRAIVVSDDVAIGMTPMNASLSRKHAQRITLYKDGYHPETVTFRTVPSAAATSYVRFNVDEVTGALNDLEPSSVDVELRPLAVPEEAGDDPFTELAEKLVEVDEQLANGEITEEDHRYILERLFEFYQQ